MIKIKSLTKEQINKLPFPKTARLLGGIITIASPEIDEEQLRKFRRQYRITIGKLRLIK